MTHYFLKSAGIVSLALLLAVCQDSNQNEESDAATEDNTREEDHNHEGEAHEHEDESNEESGEATSEVAIEGFANHYHTGDTVSLTAESDEDSDHWHWYTRGGDEGEWEVVEDTDGNTYEGEAENGQQLKAVLYDDDHNEIGESEPVTIEIDDHDGDVYEGYFDDEDVADRDISDWAGEWKSVYPYFENGDLDEVYEHRAEEDGDMSFEEYKDYYETGYETEVDNIDITEDGEFTFHEGDDSYSGTYAYDSYEILEYEAGNRGVRFIFELEDGDNKAPQFIQFSDHNIAPKKSGHFHIYWGDDNQELLDEVDHWPTYYPEEYSTEQIVDDLMLH